MKRFFFTIAIICATIPMLRAQVIKWAVPPGVYDKIEPYWENLYLVHKNGKVGVIDGTGNLVVDTMANRITGFYDGYALVLDMPDKTQDGDLILGFLSKKGSFTEIKDKYYTIPKQEFFSEGLLTVRNSAKNACFLDVYGNMSHELKGVSSVYPFTGGYTYYYVTDGDNRVSIIDKSFRQVQYRIPSQEGVRYAANLSDGGFLLWNKSTMAFKLKIRENRVDKETRYNKIKSLKLDYLGAFREKTGLPESVVYDKLQRGRLHIPSTKQGGRYGYVSNGKVILPCQLERADSIYGNSAVAVKDGRYALLSVCNADGMFSAVAINPDIKFKKNEDTRILHQFSITVPDCYNIEDISVKLSSPHDYELRAKRVGNMFEFQHTPVDEGPMRYNVEIFSEGLTLWIGTISYNYELKKDPVITPSYPSNSRVRVVVPKPDTPTPVTPKKEERQHF